MAVRSATSRSVKIRREQVKHSAPRQPSGQAAVGTDAIEVDFAAAKLGNYRSRESAPL